MIRCGGTHPQQYCMLTRALAISLLGVPPFPASDAPTKELARCRSQRVCRHQLSTSDTRDKFLFDEKDERVSSLLRRSRTIDRSIDRSIDRKSLSQVTLSPSHPRLWIFSRHNT